MGFHFVRFRRPKSVESWAKLNIAANCIQDMFTCFLHSKIILGHVGTVTNNERRRFACNRTCYLTKNGPTCSSTSISVPTHVTVHLKKVLLNSSTDIIVFTCTAVTYPTLQLSYKWIHSEDILYNDTNHVVSIWSDNSLHLDYALADDELKKRLLGDYKCVAESGYFSGSDTALIEIEKVQERKSHSVHCNIHTI